MTNRFVRNTKQGIYVIPIGIYCYLGFELIFEKLRSFRIAKHKASINAIQYVRIEISLNSGAKLLHFFDICKK